MHSAAAMLLVTWFVGGHSPNSYQVPFSDIEACRRASAAIAQDADRMRGRRPIPPPPSGFVPVPDKSVPSDLLGSDFPKVSALCVATGSAH